MNAPHAHIRLTVAVETEADLEALAATCGQRLMTAFADIGIVVEFDYEEDES